MYRWIHTQEVIILAELTLIPVQSAYVCNSRPDENFHQAGYLYAGNDSHGHKHHTLLQFDFSGLPENTPIRSASLRLFSNHTGEENHPGLPHMLASSWDEKTVTWENKPQSTDAPPGRAGAISRGWYYWDISNLVQYWQENKQNNHGLVIKYEGEDGCVRRFHPNASGAYGNYRPMLILECDEMEPVLLASREAVSRSEIHHVEDTPSFSTWRNTSRYDTYTFFVRNTGANPAKAHVQISPDKNALFDEAAEYELIPGQTQAIVPQRYAFNTRLSFTTATPCIKTRVKIWFQAHV